MSLARLEWMSKRIANNDEPVQHGRVAVVKLTLRAESAVNGNEFCQTGMDVQAHCK